jgi:hypothetical protein
MPPSLAPVARLEIGADAELVAAGDVDGDGDVDFVFAHNPEGAPSRVSLVWQSSEGEFALGNEVEVGPRPITSLQLVDVDRDGDDEIVAVDDLVLLDVRGPSGAPQIAPTPSPFPLSPTDLPLLPTADPIVADLDGDALTDVAGLRGTPDARQLVVQWGSGDPVWQAPASGDFVFGGGLAPLVVLNVEGPRLDAEIFRRTGAGYEKIETASTEIEPEPEPHYRIVGLTGGEYLIIYRNSERVVRFNRLDLQRRAFQAPPPEPAPVPEPVPLFVPFPAAAPEGGFAVHPSGAITTVVADDEGTPEAVSTAPPADTAGTPRAGVTGYNELESAIAAMYLGLLWEGLPGEPVTFDVREMPLPATARVRVRIMGLGAVTSGAGAIDCRLESMGMLETGTCDAVLDPRAFETTLVPLASPGWVFDHWTRPRGYTYTTSNRTPAQRITTQPEQTWLAVFRPETVSAPVFAVSGGASYARVCDGVVVAWGSNTSGAMGLGTAMASNDQPLPIELRWLDRATWFDSNRDFSCAVIDNDRVLCSGLNRNATLGGGTGAPQSFDPVQVMVPLAATYQGVATGDEHACAWTATGAVQCWGADGLGLGTAPHAVPAIPALRGLAANTANTCGISDATEVWCWGRGQVQLRGVGAMAEPHFIPIDPMAPTLVPLTGIVDIAIGSETACARNTSGQVLCWGSDDDGELGNGPAAGPGPVTAILPAPAVDVDASDTNVCAALETGEVYCWGENDVGQTNPLTPMARRYDTPVRVDGISGAVRVACGGIHCCSQSEDGEVLCWGSNDTLGLTSSVPVGSDFLPPTFATGSCR